jgi:autotransporter-associated beta strand protein
LLGNLGSGYTVSINSNVSVGGFQIDSPDAVLDQTAGNLTLNGTSTISAGRYRYRGGSFDGSGTIINNSTVDFVNSNHFPGSGITFHNGGTLAVTGSNTYTCYMGRFEGETGSKVTVANGAELQFCGGGYSNGNLDINGLLYFLARPLVDSTVFTLESTTNLSGNGTITFYAGTTNVNTPWSFGGAAAIVGGVTNFNAPVNSLLTISGGTVVFNNTVNVAPVVLGGTVIYNTPPPPPPPPPPDGYTEWLNPVSGVWADPLKWNPNITPIYASSKVLVKTASATAFTVNLNVDNLQIDSLEINASGGRVNQTVSAVRFLSGCSIASGTYEYTGPAGGGILAGGTITNASYFTGTEVVVQTPVINTGTINATNSFVFNNTILDNGGTISLQSPGSVVTFSNSQVTLRAGSVVSGPGMVAFSGGTIDLGGRVDCDFTFPGITTFIDSGGGLYGSGTLAGDTVRGAPVFNGRVRWTNGSVNTSNLTVGTSGYLSGSIALDSTGTFHGNVVNRGRLTVDTGSERIHSGYLYLDPGAVWTNYGDMGFGGNLCVDVPGGTATLVNHGTLSGSGEYSGIQSGIRLENHGTFHTGTTGHSAFIVNDGTIVAGYYPPPSLGGGGINSGTILFPDYGNLTLGGNWELNLGSKFVHTVGATNNGITFGGNFQINTAVDPEIPFIVSGGMNFSPGSSLGGNGTMTAGSLTGTPTITGLLRWRGGSIDSSTLTIGSSGIFDGSISINATPPYTYTTFHGNVVNNGNMNLTSETWSGGGLRYAYLVMDEGAVWTNNGTFSTGGNVTIEPPGAFGGTGTATIVNNGYYYSGGSTYNGLNARMRLENHGTFYTGATNHYAFIVNDGTIVAGYYPPPSLTGGGINSGTILFPDNGNLTLGGNWTFNEGSRFLQVPGATNNSINIGGNIHVTGAVHSVLPVNLDSGQFYFGAGGSIDYVVLNNGVLTFAPGGRLEGSWDFKGGEVNGAPSIGDSWYWRSGSISGVGTLCVDAGKTWTWVNYARSMTLALSNAGTVDMINSTLIASGGISQIVNSELKSGVWLFSNSALIGGGAIKTNRAQIKLLGADSVMTALNSLQDNSGTLTLDSRDWAFSPAGTTTFVNSGLLVRSGTGVTSVPMGYLNSGTTRVTGGQLIVQSPAQLSSGSLSPGVLAGGTWYVGNGAMLSFGTLSVLRNEGTITLDGAGSQFSSLSSLASNAGMLSVIGGNAFATSSSLTNSGTLVVGGTSQLTLTGGGTLSGGSVLLSSDGTSGGRLMLQGDLAVDATAGGSRILSTGTFSSPGVVDLSGAARTITVNDGVAGDDLLITSVLANGSLIKSGTGQLQLSSSGNTYSDTIVNAGTLAFGAGGALPTNGLLTVNSPGMVNLSGFAQTIGNLSGSGSVALSGATLSFGSSSNGGSFSGSLTGSGFVTKNGSGSTTFSGSSSFSGPLRVNDGTLILSSTNSFTGSILLNGGVLSVGDDSNLGNSGNTIALSGGMLEATGSFASSRSITSSLSSSLAVTGTNQLSLNAPLAGSGTFNKSGTGSLKLTTSNSFTGQMNVSEGELLLNNGTSITPNVGTFSVGVTGTLKLDRSVGAGPLPGGLPSGGPPLGGPPWGPDLRLSGGTLQVVGSSGQVKSEDFATLYLDGGASTIETIPNGGTLSVNFGTLGTRASGATLNWIAADPGVSDKLTFASGITDSTFLGSWFTINGTDFARYDNVLGVQPLNSYNSGFAVNTHVLLTTSAALPASPSPYPIKTLKLDSSGSLDVDLSASILQLDLGGLIKIGTGTSTIGNGTLTVGSLSSELNISVSGGTLDISATIAQTGGGTFLLTKRGSGTLTLSGSNASNYSGVTMISGALELNKPAGTNAVPGDLLISGGLVTSQANEQISDSGIVTLNAGTFNLNGKTETIAQLINNNGTVLFNGGTLTTTTTTLNGGTTTVASTLNASSTLNITGGKNTVSSSGIVNVGTLNLSGSSSASIELASGSSTSGQLILSGNVNASPTTGTLKILSTGASAVPGKLDLGGAMRTFTVASGASREDLFISAEIASGGLTKTGPGMMQLSGVNTYTQGTILNSGTLEGTATTAFGSGSIQFGVGTTSVGTLGLRGDAVSNNFGNAIAVGSSARPIFIDIDRLSPAPVGSLFLLGNATFGSNLTLTGAGTLQITTTTLTATAVVNPYDTTLVINGAIGGGTHGLILGGPAASPGGVLPGQDKGGGSGSIGTLSLDGNTKNTYTGLTTVNDGTLALNHTPGQYAISGPMAITGGTVICLQDDQFDHTINLSMLSPGGVFDLNGTGQTIHDLILQSGAVQTNGGTLNITGTISTPPPAGGLPTGSGVPTPANASIQGNLSLSPGTTFNLLSASDQVTLDANLSASGGLTLSGAGQLNLNGANTISGTIMLNGGTINAAGPASLGNATIVLNGGILNSNGAINNRIVLGGSGGQINVPLLQTLSISQPLGGAGLTKLGSGTLILSGANGFSPHLSRFLATRL